MRHKDYQKFITTHNDLFPHNSLFLKEGSPYFSESWRVGNRSERLSTTYHQGMFIVLFGEPHNMAAT